MRYVSFLLIRDFVRNLRGAAGAPRVGFAGEIQFPILRSDERLAEINGIINDYQIDQVIAMTDELFPHGRPIARRHAVPHDPSHLDMRRGHDQSVRLPFAGRKTCPCVRRTFRWMRTSVHPYRPRPSVRAMYGVRNDLSCIRIVDLSNADIPGLATHGVGHRVRNALPLMRRKYGFIPAFGLVPAGFVDG